MIKINTYLNESVKIRQTQYSTLTAQKPDKQCTKSNLRHGRQLGGRSHSQLWSESTLSQKKEHKSEHQCCWHQKHIYEAIAFHSAWVCTERAWKPQPSATAVRTPLSPLPMETDTASNERAAIKKSKWPSIR